MKYKCVIFDCDGVLVDSEFLACKTLSDMLKPFGASVSPEEIISGYVGMKDVEVIRIMSRLHNLNLPSDFLSQYEKALDSRLEKNLEAVSGIEDILMSLKIPKAIVSNSNFSRIITSVKSAGLYSYFDEQKITSPDLALFSKPDPRIYLYALSKLGLSADEAVVIEDSPIGVSAAALAGIEVIGFLATSHSDAQKDQLLKSGASHIALNSFELSSILIQLGIL